MKTGVSWFVAWWATQSALALPAPAAPAVAEAVAVDENAPAIIANSTTKMATLKPSVTSGGPAPPGGLMSITFRNDANESAYAYLRGDDLAAGRPGFVSEAGSWFYSDVERASPEKAPGIHVPPGQTRRVALPASGFSGRITLSQGDPLEFYGPGDIPFAGGGPSHNTSFGFLELTARGDTAWADLSYIDWAAVNLGFNLTGPDGEGCHNPGLPAGGIQKICDDLTAVGWGKACLRRRDNSVLGIVPPGRVESLGGFLGPYINDIWTKLQSTSLPTALTYGALCRVEGGRLVCVAGHGEIKVYEKPSPVEVLGCYSQNGRPNAATELPLLCAALNRGTLHLGGGGDDAAYSQHRDRFYTGPVVNYYAKFLHERQGKHGRVYKFPKDDVYDESGLCAAKAGGSLDVVIRSA